MQKALLDRWIVFAGLYLVPTAAADEVCCGLKSCIVGVMIILMVVLCGAPFIGGCCRERLIFGTPFIRK